MIHPINNHVLIEPVKHESFIESQKTTFDEIGIVIDADDNLLGPVMTTTSGVYQDYGKLKKGVKVYFDAWLASKYPAEKDGEFYWLVDYKDIKAVDNGDKIPELSVSEGSSSQFSNHPGFTTWRNGTV